MDVTPIFVRSGGELHEMAELPYDSEEEFQKTLAYHPRLLDFGTLRDGSARRLVLVGQEVGVPAGELSGSAFSLDHLFVDADAVPTLVEVKRASDTRARREVVAQMLDYAANGSRYWPAQLLRQSFEDTCRRDGAVPEEIYRGTLGGQDPDAFWDTVGDNLLAGRLRLLFVADRIPVELRAIVEFLNKQMAPAEVLAVELRRHRNEAGLEVLAPTVYGDAAVTAKGRSAAGRRSWAPADVQQAAQQAGPHVRTVVAALLKHAEDAGARLVSGSGAYPSVIAHYPITGRRLSTWNLSAPPDGGPVLWINLGTLVNHLPAGTVAAFADDLAAIPPLELKISDARTKDYAAWPSIGIDDLAAHPDHLTTLTRALDRLTGQPPAEQPAH
ncbi:hypothetical protein ACN3XK_71520 [Actinomadura welshii]